MCASGGGGEEEFCHYIVGLHKHKTLTTFYLQENTYAEHT